MATKSTKPQGGSAKDLLSSLIQGKKPTPKKTENRANRPALELTPALEQAFINLGAAEGLEELIESRIEREKDFLDDGCFKIWTEGLWKQKNRPANPTLEVSKNGRPDIQGIYQVQERYKLNAPEISQEKTLEEAVTDKLVDLLVGAGMPQKEAETKAGDLVANELVLNNKPIIDLDRLTNGHWEGTGKNKTFVEASQTEQAVASKLIKLIKARSNEDLAAAGHFTDEEAEELLELKPQVKVKTGFLTRVTNYVNNLDQLRIVFSIIIPVHFPQIKKFAASDTAEEKNRRHLETAADIIGLSL